MDFVFTTTEIFGIHIDEPVTSLTDLVTGIVGLTSYFRLKKLGLKDEAHILFRTYFLFIGIGLLSAGILGHALQYKVGFNAKAIGWCLSAMALFCLENSALKYYQKTYGSQKLNWLRYVFVFQLMIFFLCVINPSTRIFKMVQMNAFTSMVIFTLPLFLFFYKKNPTVGSRKVMIALFASFLPGIAYTSKFTLHTYFNYHDISHLLMASCVYLLYRGAKAVGLENEKTDFVQKTI